MADTNPGQPGKKRKVDATQTPLDKTRLQPPPTKPAPGLDRTVAAPADQTMRATPAAPATPAAAAPDKPAEADPLIGTEVGGCRIESLLGKGAMGAVYKARQVRLDRIVALKIIRPELLTDPRTLKRFEIEARTIGRFNSPHVVMIHDVGHERGIHYLVMEFVAGTNLREHTKNLPNGRMPTAEAIGYLRQACAGLEEARRLQVLHRDIKPDNLMLGERGTLKIADFGIAKPFHDDFNMTMTAELMGTPLYMSPEQCRAVPDLDFRSDMFSLGATFYYLLTGEPPAKASSIWELIETKTKLQSLCIAKAIPEMADDHPLSRVIEKMTALDRADRYGSYDEILADLALVAEGKPARPARRAGKAEAAPAAGPARAALWAVLVLAIAGGGGYAAWRQLQGGTSNAAHGTQAATDDRRAFDDGVASLRTRFRNGEDLAALRTALGSLAAPDTAGSQVLDHLRAELDAAGTVEQALTAIPRPAAALPFTDVQQFFAAVEQAIGGAPNPGPDLATRLQQARVRTRDDDPLKRTGKDALLSAWTQWQQDAAGEPDAATRAALQGRLETLRTARATLLQLFPTELADVDRQMPVTALAAAEQRMTRTVVDSRGELAAVRTAFRADGPTPALRNRLDRLRDLPADQQAQLDTLLNLFGAAEKFVAALEPLITLKPLEPKLPFTDIGDYLARVDEVRKQVDTEDADLAAFLDARCAAARDTDTLARRGATALATAWTTLQQEATAAAPAQLPALQPRLLAVLDGRRQLAALFPQLAGGLATAVPEAATTTLQQRLDAAAAGIAASGAIETTATTVQRITNLEGWLAAAKSVKADLERHATATAGAAAPASTAAALADLRTVVQRWDAAAAAVDELAKAVADGQLEKAKAKASAPVEAGPGQQERNLAATAALACVAAFDSLRNGPDLARCQHDLDEARTTWRTLGQPGAAAVARIELWQQRLERLRDLTTVMAPIAAGKLRDGEAVEAFFLGGTEVSQREFAAFLDELVAATQGIETWAARLAAVNPKCGNVVPDANKLQRLLELRSRLVRADKPVDNLCWFDAAAFANWRGVTLPNAGEWQLAAFGPGGSTRYPWGPDWSDKPEARNQSNLELATVGEGGLSWRRDGTIRLHHLAGNVAEWLAADPATGKGNLAGGHYKDIDADAKRAAEGTLRPADLDQFRPGFGLRVAVRPREVFGSLWPR